MQAILRQLVAYSHCLCCVHVSSSQVTTRLEDVQEQLRQLVAAETLLVAHSGENDLAALKVGRRLFMCNHRLMGGGHGVEQQPFISER